MYNNQNEWPGFTKFGEFPRAALEEVANGFISEGSGKAKRAGEIIKTLTTAMKEDSFQYYSIFMAVNEIYADLSNDWNSEYVKMGGELGTGKMVEQELNGSGRETILSQYPPLHYMMFQTVFAGIKESLWDPTSEISLRKQKDFSPSDFDSMRIVENLVCTIYMAILMEEKWFDRVESAIINTTSQPELQLN